MKIGLITLEYPPFEGGVAVYLKNLVEQFKPDSVAVLAQRERQNYLFDQKQEYAIVRKKLLHNLFWPKWAKAYDEARKFIKEQSIDHIIISHILPLGYVAYLLNKPYTVILHGKDIRLALKTPLKAYLTKKILSKADNIIVNSKNTKSVLDREGFVHPSIHICYPCPKKLSRAKESEVSKEVKEVMSKDVISLLSVNRLVPRKGNDMVIEALAQLEQDGVTNVQYIIAGNGSYDKELEKRIQHHALDDRVRLLHDLSDTDIAYLYDAADIFIMPNRDIGEDDVEGFGIVFLEAALFETPSIAGESGGASEAVVDGKTGLTVDGEDVYDVAQAIIHLSTDKELREQLGKNAAQRVEKEFNWEKQFELYVSFLKKNYE